MDLNLGVVVYLIMNRTKGNSRNELKHKHSHKDQYPKEPRFNFVEAVKINAKDAVVFIHAKHELYLIAVRPMLILNERFCERSE
jgi:hypothetical protein